MFERNLTHSLSAFVRYGWASPVVNPIQSNVSGGLLYKGIFQKKKNLDEAGLAMTQIHISRYHRDNLAIENDSATRPKETTYELYYSFRAFNYFNFQPDIQYIQYPSGIVKNKDALALGLRTSFEI